MVECQTRTEREKELWDIAVEQFKLGIASSVLRIDLINWNMLAVQAKVSTDTNHTATFITVFTYADKKMSWSKQLTIAYEDPNSVKVHIDMLKKLYGDDPG
jgi:hypothetical protein